MREHRGAADRGRMLPNFIGGLMLAAGLAGCMIIPIPIPVPPSGQSGEVSPLQVGKSTRANAHELLGRPNLLATPHHDLWELERDPFHLVVLWGSSPIPVYFGEDRTRYRIAIAYDEAGKVSGWRSESARLTEDSEVDWASRTLIAASIGTVEPAPAERSRIWTADAYAISPDGERVALLQMDEQGEARLELLDLVTGLSVAKSPEWSDACGDGAMTLGYDGEDVLSLSYEAGLLCRWRADRGSLTTEVISRPVPGGVMDRLLGRFVVVRNAPHNLSLWDVASDRITALPAAGRLSSATLALDADGHMLAAAFFGYPRILLVALPLGAQQVLSLPAHTSIQSMALTPAGDLLAVGDDRYVQVWRLHPDLADAPVLEAVLPLPLFLPGESELAFSPDGRRLVLASSGALVWEVDGWRQVGRVPFDTFPRAVTESWRLELTPDGSHIATPSGLWRIANHAGAGK